MLDTLPLLRASSSYISYAFFTFAVSEWLVLLSLNPHTIPFPTIVYQVRMQSYEFGSARTARSSRVTSDFDWCSAIIPALISVASPHSWLLRHSLLIGASICNPTHLCIMPFTILPKTLDAFINLHLWHCGSPKNLDNYFESFHEKSCHPNFLYVLATLNFSTLILPNFWMILSKPTFLQISITLLFYSSCGSPLFWKYFVCLSPHIFGSSCHPENT